MSRVGVFGDLEIRNESIEGVSGRDGRREVAVERLAGPVRAAGERSRWWGVGRLLAACDQPSFASG